MSKNNKIKFQYDGYETICILCGEFIGKAVCNPKDYDMYSVRTGENIAFTRAQIKMLQAEKREMRIKLEALLHLQSTIKNSKHYNIKGYVENRISNHITIYYNDILNIQEDIEDLRKILKDYIDGKEKIYQKIRKQK